MKEWFKDLTPVMQVVVIIIVAILAWLLFRTVRSYIQRAGQVSETIGEMASLQAQGQRKTYTNSQYDSYAQDLYYAMKGLGTDEDAIGSVFSQMQNDLDVIALNNAYGVRGRHDLRAWLRGDLSASDMERYVNGILRSKGITKTF